MRTIDADLLAEEITASSIANQAYIEHHAGSEWAGLIRLIYNSALEEISNAPTVDAVPVVRCKDCINWGADGYKNGCKYATCIVMENDYCSYGERKDR